jgi:hypothetical protein
LMDLRIRGPSAMTDPPTMVTLFELQRSRSRLMVERGREKSGRW